MSSSAAPADAASESQAALDSVTAWHAKYHSIEWQRYLLEPREISFLEYYREEILHCRSAVRLLLSGFVHGMANI